MSRYGFKPGDQCYKYQLDTLISNPATSQADVWLATDRATNIRVALKILDDHHAAVPIRLYEAHIGAQLKHANLCEVVGADVFIWPTAPNGSLVETTYAAIAFAYQPRGTCSSLVQGPGMMRVDRVHRLLLDVLCGLEYLHGQGWQHNDIKPANILIGSHEEYMLTDYGVAWAPSIGVANNSCYKPHIAPESIHGTVGTYVPHHQPTAHTDLYQLAVTAYRLLNGISSIRDTFDRMCAAGNEDGFFDLVRQGKIPNRNDYHPSVPRKLRQIVNRAMSPNPAERFPSALAMRRELERLHYPHVWEFEPSGQMVLRKNGVEHRIELQSAGRTSSVALVKTFPSGHTNRPARFRASGLSNSRAKAMEKQIMQSLLTQ